LIKPSAASIQTAMTFVSSRITHLLTGQSRGRRSVIHDLAEEYGRPNWFLPIGSGIYPINVASEHYFQFADFLRAASWDVVFPAWSSRLEFNFEHEARLTLSMSTPPVMRAAIQQQRWQRMNSPVCRSLVEFGIKRPRVFPVNRAAGLDLSAQVVVDVSDLDKYRFQQDTGGALDSLSCAHSIVFFMPPQLIGMARDGSALLCDNRLGSSSEYRLSLSAVANPSDAQLRRSHSRFGSRFFQPEIAEVRCMSSCFDRTCEELGLRVRVKIKCMRCVMVISSMCMRCVMVGSGLCVSLCS
jgi:hypothetical protein